MHDTTYPLDGDFEKMHLPQDVLDDGQRSRILARTLQNAGLQNAGSAEGTSSASARRNAVAAGRTTTRTTRTMAQAAAHTATANGKHRHLRGAAKKTTMLLVAAAAFCALTATAIAAGPSLLKMINGGIGFFDDASSQTAASNPLDAPRGTYSSTQQSLESYNAAVGQTVTSNGITVTLDNIAMDSATMDVFFTVSGDMSSAFQGDSYMPEWSQLMSAGPTFIHGTTVNGDEIASWDGGDYYRADDGSIKLWIHYLLTAEPQGDTVTVVLDEMQRALGVTGEWKFSVDLDGASIRTATRSADAGVFETGATGHYDSLAGSRIRNGNSIDGLVFYPLELHLNRLAFGPTGGVISTDTGSFDYDAMKPDGQWSGLDASMLYVTDSTGQELFLSHDQTTRADSTYAITSPDKNATSVTLTPVIYDLAASIAAGQVETRTVATDELKAGVKIETSTIGGYTIENFKIAGNVITWDMAPYGWVSQNLAELNPDDDDVISYAQTSVTNPDTGGVGLKSALASSTVDPKTGIYTCRLDYYAATEDELNRITTWSYRYTEGFSLDTEHAVTLPLSTAE